MGFSVSSVSALWLVHTAWVTDDSLLAFNPENEILLPNALVLSLDPTPKPNESFDGAKIDPAGRRIEDDDEDCSNEFGSAIFFYFDTSFVIKSDVKILKSCAVR